MIKCFKVEKSKIIMVLKAWLSM